MKKIKKNQKKSKKINKYFIVICILIFSYFYILYKNNKSPEPYYRPLYQTEKDKLTHHLNNLREKLQDNTKVLVAFGVNESIKDDLSEGCHETFIGIPKEWVTTSISGFEKSQQELNEVNKILGNPGIKQNSLNNGGKDRYLGCHLLAIITKDEAKKLQRCGYGVNYNYLPWFYWYKSVLENEENKQEPAE
tara:strand:- start:1791 stop:2363 length:573 start_codon:yes stop_codon:yes gene_type:complete